MPVTAIRGMKSATLRCDREGCSNEGTFSSASPAAPELTACEEVGKVGWGYNIGFQAMLLGHTVVCPDCNVVARKPS